MSIITEQMIIDYLEAAGIKCPYCKSDDLIYEDITRVDFSGCDLVLGLKCGKCHEVWYDTYTIELVSIEQEQILSKITDRMEKEYIESNATQCPYCKSTEIDGTFDIKTSFNGDQFDVYMRCKECDAAWFDYYIMRLAGVAETA
jgi:C4-type Zn-finger protein